MPSKAHNKLKPQHEKSAAHIAHQPKDITQQRYQVIMMHDLQGKGTVEIARIMGMSSGRISIIRNTPIYQEAIDLKRQALEARMEGHTDKVLKRLKDEALASVDKLIEKRDSAKNEFLQVAAAKDILDRGGYVAEKKVTTRTIELSSGDGDKLAEAIRYTETRTR